MNYLSCTCYKDLQSLSGPQLLNVWGRWRTFVRRNFWTKTMTSWVFLVCLLGFRKDFPSASDKSRICRVVSQRMSEMRDHFTLKPDTIHGFYMDSWIKAPPLPLFVPWWPFWADVPFPSISNILGWWSWLRMATSHVDEAGCWCWFCVAGSEWGQIIEKISENIPYKWNL